MGEKQMGTPPQTGTKGVPAARADASDRTDQVAALLHEVSETHHRVYRIVDGTDPDWASWYADWLINLSELPDILRTRPVRSELIYNLVRLDLEFTTQQPDQPWETFYARQLLALPGPT